MGDVIRNRELVLDFVLTSSSGEALKERASVYPCREGIPEVTWNPCANGSIE